VFVEIRSEDKENRRSSDEGFVARIPESQSPNVSAPESRRLSKELLSGMEADSLHSTGGDCDATTASGCGSPRSLASDLGDRNYSPASEAGASSWGFASETTTSASDDECEAFVAQVASQVEDKSRKAEDKRTKKSLTGGCCYSTGVEVMAFNLGSSSLMARRKVSGD